MFEQLASSFTELIYQADLPIQNLQSFSRLNVTCPVTEIS